VKSLVTLTPGLPQRTFTQNGSNVDSRKDVPLAVKSLLFIPRDLQTS